ncbi:MAG TPA: cytochrome c oxidase subunit 3 [Steroidobacteraceae bacterium]|nr:cytochrome c oxidase subunit 3 [Steroidobacteraceae bacterium]
MAHDTHSHAQGSNKYFLPHGTHEGTYWPFFGSITLFVLMLCAVSYLNEWVRTPYVFLVGATMLAILFFGWFSQVIKENEAGLYNLQVDRSFRMGMMWFIFSEVMFFSAFFGADFYARQFAVPWLGGEGVKIFSNLLLWNGYEAVWPTNGPANIGGTFEIIPALGVPFWNTLILLSSGVTVTIAHHALRAGHRGWLKVFLAATFLLGFTFVGLQAMEYHHAYTELNLTLGSGVYGSTFFMLTGFHGLHVTIGAIMLTVIWVRVMKGHFTPQRHFAFEGVAWYWHFVDVVWLGLFLFIYWL